MKSAHRRALAVLVAIALTGALMGCIDPVALFVKSQAGFWPTGTNALTRALWDLFSERSPSERWAELYGDL